jgi:PAS domain S-box-containing protein
MTTTVVETTDIVRGLLKGAREPLALIDSKGTLLAWNEPAARSLGYEVTQMIGEAFPLDQRPEVENAFRSALLGNDVSVLLPVLSSSGKERSLDARLASADQTLVVSWLPMIDESSPVSVEQLHAQLAETKKQLRESHSLIRATFETGREVTVLLSPEGTVRYISPNYGQINQLPPTELVKSDVTARIHPDDAPQIMEAVRLVAESPGASITRQARVLDANGRYIWVEATGVNLLHDKHINAIVVKSRNISAEKSLQEELERREQSLRMALESADMISLEWNLSDRTVRFSHDFATYFGVSPGAENDKRRYLTALHPDEIPRLIRSFRNIRNLGGSLNEEFMGNVPLPNGQFSRYQFQSRTFCDENGKPQRVLGIVTNITARRLAEENVLLTKARLAEAQKLARLGAWGLQRSTWAVWWSDSMYELCGVTKETFTPTYDSIFQRLDELDKPRVIEMFYRLYLTGESDPIIVRFTKPTGEIAVFNIHVTTERDRRGQMVSVLGTVQDITQQIEDENEKNALRERVQRQQELESLGILAGGIAHDFNNLLTPILGYAKLASASLPQTSPVQRSLDEVERGVLRAADLCRQMLAYAGRGRFIVGPQSLNEIAQEMSQLLESTISPRAQFHLHLAPSLPPIEADGTQVRQVVMNLLTNASDSLGDKAGHIHVATGMISATRELLQSGYPLTDLPEGDYVFIEVRDTGCGMPRETIERIFEPFFTTKFTGRGLGLAACLGIVRSHQGTILVDSKPGEGSCFRVLFPPSRSPVRPTVEEEVVKSTDAFEAGRVLIVDDSEPIRQMATKSLEGAGLEVVSAQDGVEAIEILREDPTIDTVVLDLTMPRQGGLDTLLQIRREGLTAPVILMSGYSEDELQERFGHLGFSAFLPKPFRPADLIRTVRQILRARRAVAKGDNN